MRNWMVGLGLLCVLVMSACTEKPDKISLQRADQTMFAGKSRQQIQTFLNANKDLARLYFNTSQFGNDTALVSALYTRINDPELNVLYRQVQDEFTDAAALRSQLGEAFANIKKDFPGFHAPKVVTTVTGFMGPDLVVTDSLVIIGLDYFVGPKAKYHPPRNEFPDYILRRYQPAYIAPAIVFAISDKFNATNRADQTLLADMVYYGKGYVFTKVMLPDVPDSLVIGYSDRQLTDTYASQEAVWAHVIDGQLLYQTAPAIKQRYMNERPFTAEISTQCPGAIGRWLGWRIVGRYHDTKPSISITELMRNDNARNIFAESGYKGQKDEE